MSLEVGKALRKARAVADLSQTELVGRKLRTRNGTPLTREKISSYERGEYIPEERLRPQLAKGLGVPEEELFAALRSNGDEKTLAGRLAIRVEQVEEDLKNLRQRFEEHIALRRERY
jgi:transcriptional regulator with XRE-family HTH domain